MSLGTILLIILIIALLGGFSLGGGSFYGDGILRRRWARSRLSRRADPSFAWEDLGGQGPLGFGAQPSQRPRRYPPSRVPYLTDATFPPP
jgi:hypothetical protein